MSVLLDDTNEPEEPEAAPSRLRDDAARLDLDLRLLREPTATTVSLRVVSVRTHSPKAWPAFSVTT